RHSPIIRTIRTTIFHTIALAFTPKTRAGLDCAVLDIKPFVVLRLKSMLRFHKMCEPRSETQAAFEVTLPPQNVLVLHNNNDLYGGDKILLELLSCIDRGRFSPLVVLPTDTRRINRFSSKLDEAEIEYLFLPLGVLRRRYFKPLKFPGFAVETAAATRVLL